MKEAATVGDGVCVDFINDGSNAADSGVIGTSIS